MSKPDDLDAFIADQTDPAFAQHWDTLHRRADRPATADQTTHVHGPTTTDAARLVIAGTITAARIDSRNPQETADAVLAVLAAEGYTLTRSDLFDPARIRSAIARYETTGWPTPRPVAHVAYEDAPARASHGHQEANTAPHGTADRYGAAEGTQTLSEPRPSKRNNVTLAPEDVPDEWVMLAVHAHGDANHKVLCACDAWPDGCYGGFKRDQWEHGNEAYTIAAVIPLIRAQVADEIEAATPEVTIMTSTQVIYQANGMRHAARIARGDQ